MARATLCLDNIGDLYGGAARKIIDTAIAAAVSDTDDRGHDKKPRIVTITLQMVKDDDQVLIDVTAVPKLPGYRTGVTAAKFGQKAGEVVLVFQKHAPENADQETFPEMDDKK
jgi:hypothetical protein